MYYLFFSEEFPDSLTTRQARVRHINNFSFHYSMAFGTKKLLIRIDDKLDRLLTILSGVDEQEQYDDDLREYLG